MSEASPPTNGTGGEATGHGGRPARPPAFVASVALGAIGLVVLLAGVVLDNRALSVAGAVGGALSLGAALYWRSLLISAWHAGNQDGPAADRR